MVTGSENIKNDQGEPLNRGKPRDQCKPRRRVSSLRFSKKYKEILPFLVSQEGGATMPQFFELFEVSLPVSPNEYGKMYSTLACMVGCGLLELIPARWHNGTRWTLTKLGVTHGRRILDDIQSTLEASRRRERLLQRREGNNRS